MDKLHFEHDWFHLTKFKLTRGLVFEDWTGDNPKITFWDEGATITRISDWRKGNFYDCIEKKYVECFRAEFRYRNKDIKTLRHNDDIEAIGEQLSLFLEEHSE